MARGELEKLDDGRDKICEAGCVSSFMETMPVKG
jgi:hypothetical protein